MTATIRPTDISSRVAVASDTESPVTRHHDDAPVRGVFARGGTGAFPAGALNTPMFEAKDIAGFIAAVTITLGPLAAYSLGWGA